MTLIKCKECGNEVSSKASKCPKCGASVITTHPVMQVIGVGLLILFAWAYFSPSQKNNQESATPAASQTQKATANMPASLAEPAFKISAQALYDDYHANEVAADAKYKGKLIEISGTVASISKGIANSIIVSLNAPSEFSTVHLRELSQDQTINLSKGQFVTVRCIADGMVISSPFLNCEGAKVQQ